MKRFGALSNARAKGRHVRALITALLWSTLAGCGADPPLSRVAIGSCTEQLRPQPIWETIAAAEPDLFIHGGDAVYGDLVFGPDGQLSFVGSPERLAAAYAAFDEVASFRDFRARFPILPIWDDHDLGEDDAGGDYPHKQDSERQFLEFWSIPPDDPRARRPGLYGSWFFGPPGRRLQVVLLDTRYFRSALERNPDQSDGAWRYLPDPDPTKTMLGPEQWAWLREELSKPADVRLLVSSIQVVADNHGSERWGNFPRERDRLFALIADTRANGVIFLSGDRHLAALYLKSSDAPYPLYELS